MTKHRTALILQALILIGLLLAAVVSAPTRAAPAGEPLSGPGYEIQMKRLQTDHARA